MIKKIILTVTVICMFNAALVSAAVTQISENVRFSESVYPYDGGLLISNFGSDMPTPRDDENKGYILYYKDGAMSTVVPPDGRLHCPTAMAVKDGYLFVCDETAVKVFNLSDIDEPCQVVPFPNDDKVVNAMALKGNTLYVTMTNPGRVYRLDVSNPVAMQNTKPERWLDIPGANGIAIRKNTMFVVSIPTDYATVTAENVIYRVKNINRPVAEKFDDVAALYDGVDFSRNGRKIYITDWKTSALVEIDLKTKQRRIVYQQEGIGPADLAVKDDVVYLPDLLGSKIIVIDLRK